MREGSWTMAMQSWIKLGIVIYLMQMLIMILSRKLRKKKQLLPVHQVDNLLAATLVIILASVLSSTRMSFLAAVLVTPNLVLTGIKVLYGTVQYLF